ncbi:MAG TPA: Npt1/Npt2 family nucleotide transporter [Candidatus Acidoferrum sp.]|nr:Npt1/Npt2 family nucleotide transporter [Candidatus Acidoferrum sp.]
MKRWIERALNIQSGDLGRGALLSSCLFLTISAYVIGKVARDALFLAQFSAVQLPYADIGSGVLVGFVVAIYLRLRRHISLGNLLAGNCLFFAATFSSFWLIAHYYHPAWLYPVFYIWVGIFGVLAPTQVWTLANYILTTREAKRIFGMVGGGAIFGWILAGYLSKIVTKAFGTESLLLCMAVLLSICSVLMGVASRAGKFSQNSPSRPPETAQRNMRDSLRSVFSSLYLRAIAAVICISSFVTTLTGWQFKALAKHFWVNKDALAIFFGDFYFYAGILSLIFQLLLSTRLLRRFGIGPILFVLPVVVLAGSGALLVFGTVAAVIFLKGGDQILRYSIDRSTTELLYLPLPHRVKLQAKWFIDTVVWRMGDGLAGVVVLVFAAQLHWSAQQLSWIAIALILAWLAAVFVAGRQYVAVLQDSISQHRLDAEQASSMALDRSTVDLLAQKITVSDPAEILYALSLFEVERHRAAHPVIQSLLTHPAPEVRQKAISILSAVDDQSVLPSIELLLKDPDQNVRTEAVLYLVYHANVDPLTLLARLGDYADFSVRSAVAAYLARPGEAQSLDTARQILTDMSREPGEAGQRTRLEVARLLGDLPDVFDPLLDTLLQDSSPLVVREAIRSAGALQKFSLAPALLALLCNPNLCPDASQSLAKLGDPVVPVLGANLADPVLPMELRRAIPPILVSIATPASARLLSDNLLERDTSLRFQIISSLNKIHGQHPEITLDAQLLETVLAAEIMGHYRSYQILEAFRHPGNADERILRALAESIQQELERIFRLLGLLYPRLDLHSVYFGLHSKDVAVYDSALEFLENVLRSQLRALLVPLLDGKVSSKEKAAIAERLVRAKVENRDQAVAELVASADPWLKSCGAYAIGTFGIKSLEVELKPCLEHPDPLLRETARAAKLRLDALATKS